MPAVVDDALRRLADDLGRATSGPGSGQGLADRLAEALGWGSGLARLHSIETRTEQGEIKFTRGFLGLEPAAVFATDGAGASERLLPDTARFAYHCSVHWGVVADEQRAVVFNSHWIRDEAWFRLPEIRWSELDNHLEVLGAMTPEGLAGGRLDQLASRDSPPDRFLTPVDDALVARLDHWRLEALRHGRDAERLDEDLHTLFAQLFVLRAVEDRGLAPGIPRLSLALEQGGRIDRDYLHNLFGRARDYVQNQLFTGDPLSRFPDFVLAGIINDLYVPGQLPEGSRQYNFAWIDADVLGRAYEKYLANIFRPAAPQPQLRLFDQPVREIEPISVKKSGGVFYTPSFLVSTLTEIAIERVLADRGDPDFIPRVGDFACGSGSFLVAAVTVLLRHLHARDPQRNWARVLIEGKHVVGIDVDARAVAMSRMNLWIRFTAEPDALPLPSIEEVVVLGDSLGEDVWASIPDSYDVALGNPPFIATGGIQSREDLGRRFQTARGRFDYAHLFVELAVRHLSPSGVLGMVVPNRLFRNLHAEAIREVLTSATDLLSIVDFGGRQVFRETSAYIGTLVARKRASAQSPRHQKVRVVLVSNISDTRYLGGLLLEAVNAQGEYASDTLTAFDIAHPLGGSAWVLLSLDARRTRLRLEGDGVALGEFADIRQGIRTGANDLFIVRVESTDGTLARVVNGLGESGVLETELLHPVAFGSDIQRYQALQPSQLLLYPYSRGAVLPETELQDMYPKTYEYLMAYRELLASRSSIAAGGLRWYELVRKRDDLWLSSPKLLTRDLAPRPSFALDDSGEVFLVGGTAVIPSALEVALPLLAYLNSSVVAEYLAETTPSFRGEFRKIEPQHLSPVPIPTFLVDLEEPATQLGTLARDVLRLRTEGQEEEAHAVERQIDDLIVETLGIRALT